MESGDRSERKTQTHEAILDSAARLVRDRGIAGASVADVMKGAGLTVGGFYAHFESKEQLVDEALRRTSDGLRSRLFAGIEEKPREDRAVVILTRYLSAAHRDEDALGCALPAVVGEVATRAPEHRDVLAQCLDTLVRELGTVLPDAPRPSRRRTWAIGLVALMYGGIGLARALRGTKLSDEILSACRAVGIAALRGLRDEDEGGRS